MSEQTPYKPGSHLAVMINDIGAGTTRPLAEFHTKPKIPADSVLARASSETTGIALLIEKAIESGRPVAELVEALKAAMEIQARQAFNRAIFLFRQECPPIPRARWAEMTGRNNDQPWGFSYAPLDVIDEVTRPILGRHGLSFRFIEDGPPVNGIICTVCIVRHELGHEERTPYWGPIGNNSAISAGQNKAAGNSFNKRQALTSALGLVTTDNFDNEEALALMQGVNGQAPAKAARDAIQPPRRRPDAQPQGQRQAPPPPRQEAPRPQPAQGEGFASERQVAAIRKRLDASGLGETELCRRFELDAPDKIPTAKVNQILAYLEKLVS